MTADPWEAKRDEIAKSLIQHHMTQALAYWLADLAIDVERLKRGEE